MVPRQPPPDYTPTRVLPRSVVGVPAARAPEQSRPAAPGRAAPSHQRPGATRRRIAQRVRAQLPFGIVALLVGLAFWRIALHHWREGTAAIGLALVIASVLRARMSREAAGLLAVRGKRVDVVTYAVAGVVLALVALTISGGPLATR